MATPDAKGDWSFVAVLGGAALSAASAEANSERCSFATVLEGTTPLSSTRHPKGAMSTVGGADDKGRGVAMLAYRVLIKGSAASGRDVA